MNAMKLIVPAILVAALVGVGLWWFLGDEGDLGFEGEAGGVASDEDEDVRARRTELRGDVEESGGRPDVAEDVERAPEVTSGGLRVSGRVVDEDGEPVVGATVKLVPPAGIPNIFTALDTNRAKQRTKKSVTTDAEGRFVFVGVKPDSKWDVMARPKDLCDALQTVHVGGEDVALSDLVTKAGGRLEGRVVNSEAGTPVGGAQVFAWPDRRPGGAMIFLGGGGAPDDPRSATTDSAGHFVIAGLPVGDCTVAAQLEGFKPEKKGGVKVKLDTVTPVTLDLGRGATVAGIVKTQDGAPLGGAAVAIRLQNAFDVFGGGLAFGVGKKQLERTTGADGRFEFTGLSKSSQYALTVQSRGFQVEEVEKVKPSPKDVEVAMRVTGVVWGRVTDTLSGRAVGDFTIEVEPAPENRQGEFVPRMITGTMPEARVLRGAEAAKAAGVEESGNLYAITEMPAPRIKFVLKAKGYADEKHAPLVVEPGQRIESPVALDPEAFIVGQVTDAAGKPVEGAVVVAKPAGGSGSGSEELHMMRMLIADRIGGDGEHRTGADGRFRIGGLKGNDYKVKAKHDAHLESKETEVTVEPGQTSDEIALVLGEAGAVAGIGYGVDGRPVVGAKVRVKKAKPGGGGLRGLTPGAIRIPGMSAGPGEKEGHTGTDGRFEIKGLEPGDYTAQLFPPEAPKQAQGGFVFLGNQKQGSAPLPVTITAGATAQVDLHLAAPGQVTGKVTELGRGVEGARVSLQRKRGGGGFGWGGGPKSVQTASDGRYTFDKVDPGGYDVVVRPAGAPRSVRQEVTVASEQTVHADIALPTGAISGIVIDKDSKKPIANVTVQVHKETEDRPEPDGEVWGALALSGEGGHVFAYSGGPGFGGSVKTDARGFYELRNLDAATWKVTISGTGIIKQEQKGIEVVEEKTTKGVDFQAAQGARVKVTVLLDANAESEHARVQLIPAEGKKKSRWTRGEVVEFKGLEPGTYTVKANMNGKPKEAREQVIELGSAATEEVTIDLR